MAHFPVTTTAFLSNSPLFRLLRAFEFAELGIVRAVPNIMVLRILDTRKNQIGGSPILLICETSPQLKLTHATHSQKTSPQTHSQSQAMGLTSYRVQNQSHLKSTLRCRLRRQAAAGCTGQCSSKIVTHNGHRRRFLEILSSKRFLNKQRRRIEIKLPVFSASPPLPDDGGFPEPSQVAGSPPAQLRRSAIIRLVLLRSKWRLLIRRDGAGIALRRGDPGRCCGERRHSETFRSIRIAMHEVTRNLIHGGTS